MTDFNFVLVFKDGTGGSRKIKADNEKSAYKELINSFNFLPPKIIISLAEPLHLEKFEEYNTITYKEKNYDL